jgi:hypothetical protein
MIVNATWNAVCPRHGATHHVVAIWSTWCGDVLKIIGNQWRRSTISCCSYNYHTTIYISTILGFAEKESNVKSRSSYRFPSRSGFPNWANPGFWASDRAMDSLHAPWLGKNGTLRWSDGKLCQELPSFKVKLGISSPQFLIIPLTFVLFVCVSF